jgi:hypothetical protein
MSILNRLIAAGAPPQLSKEICGTVSTISAAGTTLGSATPLPNAKNNVTVGIANAGVALALLAPGEEQTVYNNTGATIKIYPFDANGTINGGGAGAAVTLATGKMARFECVTLDNYMYVVTG